MTSKKIYLVDTSSFIFRAFHALPPLTNPQQVPVNALYGFVSMICKLFNEHHPSEIIFCLDSKEKGIRHQIYPAYKANRIEMPDELKIQIPLIYEFLELLKLPTLKIEGVEADDLIGSLTKVYMDQGYQVIMISGDKDLTQLVSANVVMYDPMKDIIYDEKAVEKKWGVPPRKMTIFLALIGDVSDNIPGVRGIGPKRAAKILQNFSNLDEIYSHLDKISAPLAEKLKNNKDLAYICEKLVTINREIPLPKIDAQVNLAHISTHEVREFLRKHNFKSLIPMAQKAFHLSDLSSFVSSSSSSLDISCNKESLREILNQHHDNFWICFNQEQNLMLSVPGRNILVTQEILWDLSNLLKDRPFQGINLKEIAHYLKLDIINPLWDHAIAGYLLDPQQPLDLSSLMQKYLNFFGHPTFLEHEQLKEVLQKKLDLLFPILINIEMPVLKILYAMEKRGIKLDVDFLLQQSLELKKEIEQLEISIYEMAGRNFNVNSTKQLSDVLFKKLMLPIVKKTKTGYSTDNDVLEELKTAHPIIGKILEYRELSKLKSTYVDSLPQYVDQNQRIHTTFNQTGTATGRLSSQDPNLQNIPIRTERGEQLRKAFITEEGYLLGSFDYNQIELRILAHYSEEPVLVQAFHEGLDIHKITASEIFEVSQMNVTVDQRRIAKAVNFGILYGQTPYGLAESLHINQTEAKLIIDRHHKKFPKVREYLQFLIEQAHRNGYVVTLLGRKRYLPDLKSTNYVRVNFAERAAINTPMQGSAADIVKMAMIEVFNKFESQLILQIHDELIFEASEYVLQNEQKMIQKTMENIYTLKVPLIVNSALGKTWKDIH